MTTQLTVRETIHHGDYHNVREQAIEPTFAGMVELLQASPYNSGKTLEGYASNQYVMKMIVGLLADGCGEFGWATYVLVEK